MELSDKIVAALREAVVCSPDGVLVLQGMDDDMRVALYETILATGAEVPLIICLPDGVSATTFTAEGMADMGWYQGDPAGDADDPVPWKGPQRPEAS